MSLVASTTNKCAACYQSYIDANGVCTAPTTAIVNAFTYTNATTVARCNDGYQLASNACTAINQTTYANAGYLNASNNAISTCASGYSTVTNVVNSVSTVTC
jgi:hypothetical protein